MGHRPSVAAISDGPAGSGWLMLPRVAVSLQGLSQRPTPSPGEGDMQSAWLQSSRSSKSSSRCPVGEVAQG